MVYEVKGGTHIGIVGCYGVKRFHANDVADLLTKIRKDRKLGAATLVPGRVPGAGTMLGFGTQPLEDVPNWTFFNGNEVKFEVQITVAVPCGSKCTNPLHRLNWLLAVAIALHIM